MKRTPVFFLALGVAMLSLPALAQDVEYAPPANNGLQPGNTAASIDVQLSNIQDQMRKLEGEIEQNQFQIKQLSENMAKLQRDSDYRLTALENKAAAPVASPASPPPIPPTATVTVPGEKTQMKKHAAEASGLTTGGNGVLEPPGKNKSGKVTPREQYNYAFRLLNKTQYPEAASAFDQFTRKFPKDPLVGNAYYWEGETYYIRKDYVKAADNFRKGFEALPDGPKAADNLLKLAMSLDALNHDKDACVVLRQIVTKYRKISTSVTGKASQEEKRIGCK